MVAQVTCRRGERATRCVWLANRVERESQEGYVTDEFRLLVLVALVVVFCLTLVALSNGGGGDKQQALPILARVFASVLKLLR